MKRLSAIVLLIVMILAPICMGQSVIGSGAAPSITVTIAPPGTITLQTGTSQLYTATITNDFLVAGAIWTLSGPGCAGATCGSLSPSFRINGSNSTISLSASAITYTAPSSVPSPANVTLTATSIQDLTKFASVQIIIQAAPPPVVPNNVSALTSQTAVAKNTFLIPATQGNNMLVGVSRLTTDTVSSVQGCLPNNTCSTLTLTDTGTNAASTIAIAGYRGVGLPAGITSIVVNNSVATGTVAVAYADVSTAGAFDVSAHVNNQSGTNPSGPAVTTTVANDFVGSFVVTTGTVSASTAPFALSQGSAGFGFAEATAISGAAGSVTPSYTATTGNWAAVTMAFKPNSNSNAPISVSLLPTAPTVQTNGTRSFTATVANDTANAGVNVTYTGTGCSGGTCGTGPATASNGVPFTYTAPASVPGAGGSAITRVQHGSSTCNLSGSASINRNNVYDVSGALAAAVVDLTAFTATGNAYALGITTADDKITVTGATDDKGNAWGVRASATDNTEGESAFILTTQLSGATSGFTVIHVTMNTTNPGGFFGAVGAYLIDMTTSGTFTLTSNSISNQPATTNPVGPAISPTGAGVVIAQIGSGGGNVSGVAGPFSLVSGQTAYYANPGTGSISPNWTTGSHSWGAAAISIVPSGSVASCSVSISPSISSGTDLLCGLASWSSPASGTLMVTDNLAQTYINKVNGPDYALQCKYGGSSVNQLTYNISSNPANVDVYYLEYTGISTGTPDQIASNNAIASGTTFDSGSTPATTNAADLLIGFAKNSSANVFTAGGDGQGDTYTKLDSQTSNGSATQDFFPTTATNPYKSIMTTNATGTGEAAVAAFKGAAGGGGSTPVLVTATSVTDPTKSAQAVVTITSGAAPISVSIAPPSASVFVSGTQTFTPTILNDGGSNTVTWSLSGCSFIAGNCGTVSPTTTASGVATTYTAPSAINAGIVLTATDVTDNTKSASVNLTIINQAGPFHCVLPNCPAFPGAEGGGSATPGGRGGTVMEVTTTADSGSGSLRACATASGPRTCVFRVAGIFTPLSQIFVGSPFLTIDGQSAPGQVILGGPTTPGDVLRISTHDVIVRYVTLSADNRQVLSGPSGGTSNLFVANCSGSQAITTTSGCNNIMFDHVTTRWAGNKTLPYNSGFAQGSPSCSVNCNGPNHNITFQWGMLYEPHAGHPVGPGGSTDQSCNINLPGQLCLGPFEIDQDYANSMFANIDHRIPEGGCAATHWINNITTNWSSFAISCLGTKQIDVINNIWKRGNLNALGPSQQWPILIGIPGNANQSFPSNLVPSVYIAGNIDTLTGSTPPANQQVLANQQPGENLNGSGPLPSSWVRNTPMAPDVPYPITIVPAAQLEAKILATVGNSQHLDCNGNWVNHRDGADSRIIQQYRNGYVGADAGGFWPNGIWPPIQNQTSPNQIPVATGTYTDQPVTAGFTVCTESAHDGIPDAWKSARGLSLTDPNLHNAIGPTGLTRLEEYMAGPQ